MSEVMKYPQSSNVAELEYIDATDDASSKLVATFKDGKRYSYSAVPRDVWLALQADSASGHVGNAFARHIRGGNYAYARLDDDLDLEEAGAARPLDEAPRRRYQRIEQGPPSPTRPRQPAPTPAERKASVANRRRTKPS
jgi:hypothetical protein